MNHLHKYALCSLLATTICINAADTNTPMISPSALIKALNAAITNPKTEDGDVSEIERLLNQYPEACQTILASRRVPLQELPLHLAARNASPNALSTLIMHGANPNQLNKAGETPLHTVGTAFNTRLLIANGANPNIKNNDGQTPLHKIPFNSLESEDIYNHEYLDSEIVDELFAHRIRICAQDNNGNTPLHTILLQGTSLTIAGRILEKAREWSIPLEMLNIRNNKGQSPVDIVDNPFFEDPDLSAAIRVFLGQQPDLKRSRETDLSDFCPSYKEVELEVLSSIGKDDQDIDDLAQKMAEPLFKKTKFE